ncbi:hypothetical protein ACFQE5_22150 [Pseudonocardia hispaniensis]|uniref:Uncharacterized protein n=1 Tax=Pseudonocardia hispaniensis TaxID=904933 RepID=A0ABW1J820_9PSEU
MTDRRWPTREQWAANAEKAVRHACYPHQRVPEDLHTWADQDDRDLLARRAVEARRACNRIARTLAGDTTRVQLADIDREMTAIQMLVRLWDGVLAQRETATTQAVEDAVAREVARRQTDEAWERELRRRADIDKPWVITGSVT